jgi:hypothetical protein
MGWGEPKENPKIQQCPSHFERQTEIEGILLIEVNVLILHGVDNRLINA